MDDTDFDFTPVERPKKWHAPNKYDRAVAVFAASEHKCVQVNIGQTPATSAASSFRNAVNRGYAGQVRVRVRNNALYLEKS